ncbi:hypothetical protein KQH54_02135 [bacterium]|nr:hypothetical protein [bacterium]
MATQNLIIQNIQKRISRINNMIHVGKRLSSPGEPTLAQGFSIGEQFVRAAKKMRFLDKKNLGNIQPEDLSKAGSAITHKFENVNQLLRLPPKNTNDPSFWSDLEKSYFNQSGGSPETPPQSGALQRGTVIQKYDMFPKAGQSLDSFIKQRSTLPKSVPPKRKPTPPKKSPTPTDRLYSRIEEIKPGKMADPLPEIQQEQKPSQVQSKPETLPKIENPVDQPESKPALSAKESPTLDLPPTQAKADEIITKAPEANLPKPALPQAKAPKKKNQASAKPTLATAKPKPKPKSAPSSVQRQLDTSKPRPAATPDKPETSAKKSQASPTLDQLPTSSPPTKIDSETLQAAEAKPTSATKPSMELPTRQKPPKSTSIEDTEASTQKAAAQPTAEALTAESKTKTPKTEHPLQDQILQHRKQSKKIISLNKEILKPVTQLKDLAIFKEQIKIQFPTTPPEPSKRSEKSTSLPDFHQLAASFHSAPAQDGPQTPQYEMRPGTPTAPQTPTHNSPKTSTAMEPLAMEVPQRRAFPPVPSPTQLAQAKTAVQPAPVQPALQQTAKPSPATANTVQRIIDDIPSIENKATNAVRGMAGASNQNSPASSSASASEGSGSSTNVGSVDLDQLAKDIIPMVKRLLEIEAERSSRFFK